MKTKKIEVVKDGSIDGRYRLRIWVSDDESYGTVLFETGPEFTRTEADFRAIVVAAQLGLDRDHLPERPYADTPPWARHEPKPELTQ